MMITVDGKVRPLTIEEQQSIDSLAERAGDLVRNEFYDELLNLSSAILGEEVDLNDDEEDVRHERLHDVYHEVVAAILKKAIEF